MTEEKEEQQQQEDKNKRIRPRERARGQKCIEMHKGQINKSYKKKNKYM